MMAEFVWRRMRKSLWMPAAAGCALVVGCGAVDPATIGVPRRDFYLVAEPHRRHAAPADFFVHEYEAIHTRRSGRAASSRPVDTLGLAFSGGGIRSAAFQLGLLAGLHDAPGTGGRNLLGAVDYISSVSGGSWASGSYWSSEFSDAEFFRCLLEYARHGHLAAGCEGPTVNLRNSQRILLAPLATAEVAALDEELDREIDATTRHALGRDGLRLIQRKQQWEEDIVRHHLGRCNIDFRRRDDPRCERFVASRPYPIFNSTHSAKKESASDRHHTFQTTPHYAGTISDDGAAPGFFVRLDSVRVDWQYRKWQRYFALTEDARADRPGTLLSLALAHSSGVVGSEKPPLLQYNLHARVDGKRIEGIRSAYHINDGGKSDNLGLVALLERGVDLIVVSQMGKEGEELKDFGLSAKQAKRLLQCEFRHDARRGPRLVEVEPYACASGVQGKLVLVRPTIENRERFLAALAVDAPDLHRAVLESDAAERPADRFPETKTFRSTYPTALVRAYFMLGHWLVESELRAAIASRGGQS